MKIISWNVNSVRARITNILDYIKQSSPDILFLQEIKTQDISFPYEDFKSIGYNSYVFGQKRILKNNNFYTRSRDDISFSCSLVSMAPGRYCRIKEIGSSTIPSFLHNKAAIRPDLPSPALQCIRMFLSF